MILESQFAGHESQLTIHESGIIMAVSAANVSEMATLSVGNESALSVARRGTEKQINVMSNNTVRIMCDGAYVMMSIL